MLTIIDYLPADYDGSSSQTDHAARTLWFQSLHGVTNYI